MSDREQTAIGSEATMGDLEVKCVWLRLCCYGTYTLDPDKIKVVVGDEDSVSSEYECSVNQGHAPINPEDSRLFRHDFGEDASDQTFTVRLLETDSNHYLDPAFEVTVGLSGGVPGIKQLTPKGSETVRGTLLPFEDGTARYTLTIDVVRASESPDPDDYPCPENEEELWRKQTPCEAEQTQASPQETVEVKCTWRRLHCLESEHDPDQIAVVGESQLPSVECEDLACPSGSGTVWRGTLENGAANFLVKLVETTSQAEELKPRYRIYVGLDGGDAVITSVVAELIGDSGIRAMEVAGPFWLESLHARRTLEFTKVDTNKNLLQHYLLTISVATVS